MQAFDNSEEEDYYSIFLNILNDISNQYEEFPGYIIRMMAIDHKFPHSELKILKTRAIHEKKLIPLQNQYFTISKK